ncbi:hypothetical protein KC343_g2035 [Hortaea werneckii]|uniref:Integral membrane protein TmpA n=1 Tax=Hortaea werneckii TaxID=91943 RepID=A0A3M7EZZ4_HORWE|nr:hypothetical protein KC352_g6844 [Hortaea werneckii]KAI7566039.1 hypothetical protein KC317_g5939 [Hortaea werneckii]KAI7616768.1 hypothetical protein KC346_g5835 [Hortaea werneckii]KAI7635087.1 hypothetical protein KC343_g2035 [Hortaea werneckii]KAI7677944.1 hypothetical protein KC319_g3618 [Hortaea werneckii]
MSSCQSTLRPDVPEPVHFHPRSRSPTTFGIISKQFCAESQFDSKPTNVILPNDKESESSNNLDSPLSSIAPRFITREELEAFKAQYTMPEIQGQKLWGTLRFKYLSTYRMLMATVFALNLAAALICFNRATSRNHRVARRDIAITATSANLTANVLMRQEHFINALFHIACGLPASTPLQLRRQVAKLAYSQGGIHAACGISALAWYIYYIVQQTFHSHGKRSDTVAYSAISALVIGLLAVVITTSIAGFRRRFHDHWELSHRFGGWSAICLFWAQIIISAVSSARKASRPAGSVLVSTPSFWMLIVITVCLIYPWLWLRRLPVKAQRRSTHAIELRLHNRNVASCASLSMSISPVTETHNFVAIPHAPEDPERGYSVIVSNAGDWTRDFINSPPTHVWHRGAPVIGMMRIAACFRPVLVIATGSGIGPCLSFLNCHRGHPAHVLWSARSPEDVYGGEILSNVLEADRGALIIDTKETGRFELTEVAWAKMQQTKAEAAVIISNAKVTRDVVFGMEARGIIAFGAIFDS